MHIHNLFVMSVVNPRHVDRNITDASVKINSNLGVQQIVNLSFIEYFISGNTLG